MSDLNVLFQKIKQRDPNQAPFHQAVEEVFGSLAPFLAKNPQYTKYGLLDFKEWDGFQRHFGHVPGRVQLCPQESGAGTLLPLLTLGALPQGNYGSIRWLHTAE